MALKYPNNVKNDSDKLEYCFNVSEKLRQEHNLKGAQYMKGALSSQDFEKYLDTVCLAQKMDISQSSAFKITANSLSPISKLDWDLFKNETHKERQAIVSKAMWDIKVSMRSSKKYFNDIDTENLE